MERLTERDEYGNADIIALSDIMPELYAQLSYSETNALTDTLNKLAAYEDAEENGTLVRLPCKVGDTVWTIDNEKVQTYGIHRFHVYSHAKSALLQKIDSDVVSFEEVSCVEFGKTVFITREEAEKALKERESE